MASLLTTSHWFQQTLCDWAWMWHKTVLFIWSIIFLREVTDIWCMLSEELCRSHYTLFPMLLDHDLKLIQCLFTHVWQSNSTFTVKFTVGISFWIRAHNPLHKSAIRKPGLSKLCFIWLLFLSHLNKIMEFKNQDKFKDKFHYILQNFCKF